MTRIDDLKNKAVLITGASSGIGAALARAFGAQGARLALHFNSHEDAARALAGEIGKCGAAPVLWLLLVARAVQGVGAAIMMALAMASVGDAVPKERTGSAMGLLYPQAIKWIIDATVGNGSPGGIDRAAIFMLVVFAVEGVAVGLRAAMFSIAGERIVARLRERLYRAIVAQEIGFFDEP